MAFAGPQAKRSFTTEGYHSLTPEFYLPYFQKKNVRLVVRLNKKCYDEKDFTRNGIQHLEQYYLDGSCPPMSILQTVLKAFESVPSTAAFAVHCKAGLGRTGTCIGAYLMKHYKFTAAEAIAWMRICRPGCVIGPQQHYLQDIEQRMWHEGSVMKLQPNRDGALQLRGEADPVHVSGNDKYHVEIDTEEEAREQTEEGDHVDSSSSTTNKGKKEAVSPKSVTTGHFDPYPASSSSSSRRATPPKLEEPGGIPGQAEKLLAARRKKERGSSSTTTPVNRRLF